MEKDFDEVAEMSTVLNDEELKKMIVSTRDESSLASVKKLLSPEHPLGDGDDNIDEEMRRLESAERILRRELSLASIDPNASQPPEPKLPTPRAIEIEKEVVAVEKKAEMIVSQSPSPRKEAPPPKSMWLRALCCCEMQL